MPGKKRKNNDYFAVEQLGDSRSMTKYIKQQNAIARRTVPKSYRVTRSAAAMPKNLFELINGQTSHVGAIVLKSCNVLDLCKLAEVSKEARKAAKSAMSLRRLEVTVGRHVWGRGNSSPLGLRWNVSIKDQHGHVSELKYTETEVNRYTGYRDQPSQLVLHMARHANVQSLDCCDIYHDFDPVSAIFNPEDTDSDDEDDVIDETDELPDEKKIALDRLAVTEVDFYNCLQVFTPKHLKVVKAHTYKFSRRSDCSHKGYAPPLDAAHPAVFGAKSLVLHDISLEHADEAMLKLSAERIILCAERSYHRWSGCRERNKPDCGNSQWSRKGIAEFIQQWLRSERNIALLACALLNDEAQAGCAGYAEKLTDLLRKLPLPPASIKPLTWNDVVKSRLYYVEKNEDAAYNPDATVSGMIYKHPVALSVERPDGKRLAMVLRREHVEPILTKFEDYSKYNQFRDSPDVDQEKKEREPGLLSDFALTFEMFEL